MKIPLIIIKDGQHEHILVPIHTIVCILIKKLVAYSIFRCTVARVQKSSLIFLKTIHT